MDLSRRLAISYYKTIATINEEHKIFLVQHQSSKRIFIKKILDVYNINVYNNLKEHPISGTPRIIDFYEEDHQLFLIEEYVSGTPLDEKIANHEINSEDVINYALDLCDILEKLHELNPPLIHRDIKPSNIIITNYNQAVLLDFNAAKQFTATEPEDTVLLGTKGYAAPEQYGFGSSTPLTDIYSLGVVLKEMLSACNLSANNFSSNKFSFSNFNSDKLNRIVNKCTQLNPNERYSSISELKKELRSLIKQAPEKRDFKEHSSLQFLPPGFRTLTPWKILISTATYLFVFWICLTLEVVNVHGAALWFERIICLAMILSIICISFNYMNIQKLMPLCRHTNRFVRILGIAIFEVAIEVILIIILVVVGTSIFHIP